MNDLSWLIYLADVAGNLRGLAAGGVFIILVFGGTGLGLLWAFNIIEKTGYRPVAVTITWAIGLTFCGTLTVVTPSTRTIYMIAASEAGEAIATTPDAIEMMGDLKAIIKKRLKEELAE